MVYTLMPLSLAISAAVSGAMSPVLLEPSVSNMMLFDLALPSTMRLMLVASPSPIAVPSSSSPISTELTALRSDDLSVVIGSSVKLSPANTTRPMLSDSLPLMNSDATSLAAAKRSGVKSFANILVDMSRAMTMSVPSTLDVSHLLLVCGRQSITMRQPMASSRTANSPWRSHTR